MSIFRLGRATTAMCALLSSLVFHGCADVAEKIRLYMPLREKLPLTGLTFGRRKEQIRDLLGFASPI